MPRDITSILQRAFAGRYRVGEEISRGAFGLVFKAFSEILKTDVALKILRPEFLVHIASDRFVKEMTIATKLQHPHIVRVLDSGEMEWFVYFAMQFIEGGTLAGRLAERRPIPINHVLDLGTQISDALHYAHQEGVIHGDVKPSNILLDGDHALLSDFSLALIADAVTHLPVGSGEPLYRGTASYGSPELLQGDATIDGRSDIYSLGCVLFEMLVGEPPFTGPNARVIVMRHLNERVPSIRVARRETPVGLQQIIERCLAKPPTDRYQTAQELGDDLRLLTQRFGERQVAERRGRPPKKIFIGHGRSTAWHELRDFLERRLGLEWEEFNREAVAGKSTVERLEAMLDAATFAFLVLTPEDEHADGTLHARENVIHELGLCQGRLGLRRAIIILEVGTAGFSNVEGLTQIHFEPGRLLAKTEEIRQVLEREGLLGHLRK